MKLSDLSFKEESIIEYYHKGEIKSGKLDIKIDPETVEKIKLDIIKLKNSIENNSDFDYISEIEFITQRYNLYEYKKKII